MTVYCVSYDLNKSGQKYDELYEELKSSSGYWHYLDSTWLISTTETAEQVYSRLKKHIDDNDRVLIIKVVRNYQGWLSEAAWKWIKDHVTDSA